MPRELLEVHLYSSREENIQRIFGMCALLTRRYGYDITTILDNTLRDEETCGQFAVMARRAHRYGHAPPSYPDFQRLLSRNNVCCLLTFVTRSPAQNLDRTRPIPAGRGFIARLNRGRHGAYGIQSTEV